MKQHLQHPVFSSISRLAAEHNMQAYAIGGFVRDIFLNRPSKDIDIVVIGNGIAFAESVAQKLRVKVSIFKNFGTASLKYQDLEIEFVGARRESYRLDSRKPIVENGTLDDDQKRRDFTINALAISLHPDTFGELLDPFNGLTDLAQKLIRTPLNPVETFSDDPLRMMRAIRFASQLNFRIDEIAVAAIKSNVDRISIISQ
jgi:poly(A) polymerase